jgi:hypothetical protein
MRGISAMLSPMFAKPDLGAGKLASGPVDQSSHETKSLLCIVIAGMKEVSI